MKRIPGLALALLVAAAALPPYAVVQATGAALDLAAFRLPLPPGPWLVVQGDARQAACTALSEAERPSHCDGVWDVCAVDFAAAPGAGWGALNYPVLSVADGEVIAAGWHADGGNYVLVEHPVQPGLRGAGGPLSLYLHLEALEVAALQPSQAVVQGQVLGYAGATGSGANGRHLHFAVFESRATMRCRYLDGLDGNAAFVRAGTALSTNTIAGAVRYPASADQPAQWTGIPLGYNFENGVRLLGYELQPAGARLDLTLYWRVAASAGEDGKGSATVATDPATGWVPAPYHVFAHVLDPTTGTLVAQQDYEVGPLDWAGRASGAVRTEVVHIDIAAVPPGKYEVGVGLYAAGGRRLSAGADGNAPLDDDWIALARNVEFGCPQTLCARRQLVNARFADRLELLGVGLIAGEREMALDMDWRALATIRDAFAVFVHVIDTAGRLVAQSDRVLRAPQFPLPWLAGDRWTDRVVVDLKGLAPGEYHIGVGVYAPQDRQRLAAARATGERYADDWVALPVGVPVGRSG